MTDPVDTEETPEEEKDDGFDFEDDSPAPMIDDDAVLESEDTYECLSSTEVDHLEKEDQEMEHEKLCMSSLKEKRLALEKVKVDFRKQREIARAEIFKLEQKIKVLNVLCEYPRIGH